ncbi:hypothetical protein [Bradyrhizobium sp. CCBAU 45384]|uniref:hypothetical protein n=1 Tax=Bradyrhizobium sp. CCBAU 45384 TaxID=858428 RepID=UPI002305A9E3|nr:hypothetical protein [Bradyrhizobium sp. CCBAU 45384]MDA9410133.1 hypothetical protein [Bradyrhizobium sp. CCBAU 45384]MDA9442009.1 hypothetical protein [Bradyrhizobium sp. CCBAU 51745]
MSWLHLYAAVQPFVAQTIAQWTAGASRLPAFPAPSALLRAMTTAKLGHDVPRDGEDMRDCNTKG